jgi:hypothetical protein
MDILTYLGRQIIRREKVAESGTFSSFYSAERKLKNMGYTLGSMCGSEPIGFANIGMDERNKLDGVMISDDWREGIVQIIWFNEPLE